MVRIEKNIPIPAVSRKMGEESWNTVLARMGQGDSFVTTKTRVPAVWAAAKSTSAKIVTRSVDKDKTRIWRV